MSEFILLKKIYCGRESKIIWMTWLTSALEGIFDSAFSQSLGAHKNNWQTLAAVSGSNRWKEKSIKKMEYNRSFLFFGQTAEQNISFVLYIYN